MLSECAGIVGGAARCLRRGLWPMLVALAIAEAVAAAALSPLGAGAVNWLIRRSGRYAVANEDLAGFVFSPLGATTLFVAATVALTVAGVGRAAVLLASQGARRAGRASGVLALAGALARLPRIVGLSARQVVIAAWIGAPFAAALVLIVWMTLRGADMYWIVAVRPTRFWVGAGLAAPVALAGAWFVGRRALLWSIALPLCVLCGRRARAALRESESLLRGRLRAVAAVRLAWLGAVSGVGLGAIGLVQIGAEFVLRREMGGMALTAAVAGAVLLVYLGVGFVVSLVASLGDVAAVQAAWARYAPGGEEGAEPVELASGGRAARGARAKLLALLAAGAVVAGVGTARLLATARAPVEIEVTAHRGAARVAPENTLAAIRAAIEMGVDRIEVDVMRTADGGLVLFHDTDLRRIARDPRRVAAMTLAEMREVDAGSWFGPEFAGERVPTLEEAIEAVRGHATLNLELKTAGDEDDLAAAVAAVVRAHAEGGAAGAIVTSLSTRAVSAMRRADPSARIGLIVTASIGDLRRVDVDLLAVESGIATGRFLRRAKRAGLPVHVWGVSDPDQFTRLALLGVEGVITSDPGAMLARRQELAGLTEVERILLAFRMRVIGRWVQPEAMVEDGADSAE